MAERIDSFIRAEKAKQIYIARDVQILQGLYSNDAHAWESFYKVQMNVVYKQAFRMGLELQDAEDVAQNVALITYKYVERTRNGNDLDAKPIQVLTPWIRRITTIQCIHHWRKINKHPEFELFDEIAEDINSGSYQDMAIERVDFEKRFECAWNALSDKEKAIIQSRITSGGRFSYAEFTKEHGIPHGNVGPAFTRAKRKILNYMNQSGEFKIGS